MRIIGVAGRDTAEAAEAFVSDLGVSDIEHILDEDGSVWAEYGVFLQPSTAVINDDGTQEVFMLSMGPDGLTTVIDDILSR